jgi:hypothetical protein
LGNAEDVIVGKHPSSKRHRFYLIELLVVLVLVGIV